MVGAVHRLEVSPPVILHVEEIHQFKVSLARRGRPFLELDDPDLLFWKDVEIAGHLLAEFADRSIVQK